MHRTCSSLAVVAQIAAIRVDHTRSLSLSLTTSGGVSMITPPPALAQHLQARDVSISVNYSPSFSSSAWVCGSYVDDNSPVSCSTDSACAFVTTQGSNVGPLPLCCGVEDVPSDGTAPFLDLEFCVNVLGFGMSFTACENYTSNSESANSASTDYAATTFCGSLAPSCGFVSLAAGGPTAHTCGTTGGSHKLALRSDLQTLTASAITVITGLPVSSFSRVSLGINTTVQGQSGASRVPRPMIMLVVLLILSLIL